MSDCGKGPVKSQARNKEYFSNVGDENSILWKSVEMQYQCIDQVLAYRKIV